MLPKQVKQKDINPQLDYVFCVARLRSRQKTIDNWLGDHTDYRYYKTKGYFEAMMLLPQRDLGVRDVCMVVVKGDVLIKKLQTARWRECAVYLHTDWRQYVDAMFGSQGVRDAKRDFSTNWDNHVMQKSWNSGFADQDRRLPRQLANSLKDTRNLRVYQACKTWFKEAA